MKSVKSVVQCLCFRLAALFLAGAFAPTLLQAKSVDYSPHFDNESYWNTHAIYLARITDIKIPAYPNGPDQTTLVPVKIISGAVNAKSQTIQSSGQNALDGPYGEFPEGFPVGLHTNDQILVCENTSYHQVTVAKVMDFPADLAMLSALEQIAALRKAPTFQAVLAGATSHLDLLAGYCFAKLPSFPDQTISNDDAKRLRSFADDATRPAALRISAEQAALRYSGMTEPARNDAEYAWLRGAVQAASLSTNANPDLSAYSIAMSPMIDRLFRIGNKQQESADYILRLIADQNAPTALRAAACSALSSCDSEVFNFKSPDERFDRMFDTYIRLLSDKNPDLRIQGMAMLFDRTVTIMKTQTPPDLALAYARKAVQALVKAMAVETNERVMTFFKSRAWQYEDAGNNLMDQFRKSATNEIR